MKKWISWILVLVLCTAFLIPAGAESIMTPDYSKATVIGGWLRLRAAPSYDAETLASCPDGTEVTVISSMGSWYYVKLANGLTGYMASSFLKLNHPDDGKTYVSSSNGRDVRLRSGPGTGYEVIGTYSVGTSLKILSRGEVWHYIEIGKQRGYMMAQFISGGNTNGYMAYITSGNGLSVRLRTGPGTNYSVLGSYSVGTAVTVLEHGKYWDYVSVGSRMGYIMTNFLTIVPPSTQMVTNVSLSNYSPVVGETISAILTPANAQVTYLWTNDQGNVVSTGAQYKVTEGQTGRMIRLTVTGKGMTTGSATSKYTAPVANYQQKYVLTGVTINCMNPEVGDVLTASVSPAGANATYAWYRADGKQLSTSKKYTVTKSDIGYRLYCVAIGYGEATGAVVSQYTDEVVKETEYHDSMGYNNSVME